MCFFERINQPFRLKKHLIIYFECVLWAEKSFKNTYMLTWELQKPSGEAYFWLQLCLISVPLLLFLWFSCVLSLHLLRSASLDVNVALNPTVWRTNVFSLCGLSLLGDFYSSPPMNIILNHTATEPFAALLKSQLLRKAIRYLALHNLEQKSPCG